MVIEGTRSPCALTTSAELARTLRTACDEALNEGDVLIVPFDVTGDSAASVPCGMSEGRPVEMMLIGRHWEDGTVLNAERRVMNAEW